MKAAQIIYDILKANSPVNTAVGGRFYPMRIVAGASFPCVQYMQVSTVPVAVKNGAAQSDFARVQINCYASTYKEATELASLVRTALEHYKGTINTNVVHHIEFLSAVDQIEDNASYSGIYSTIMDFMIDYNV